MHIVANRTNRATDFCAASLWKISDLSLTLFCVFIILNDKVYDLRQIVNN